MTLAIPKVISEHRYGKLFGRIWTEVHYRDGIVCIVFCGKRGKGKSQSMAELARMLDRSPTTPKETRFFPENIRFDPVEFFTDLTGNYPIGKVICLDDAGLHMYKSDALTDLLKRISKILQNIRYKHPIVMLSLPYFPQLMKDARDMTDVYIEMLGVNRARNKANGIIQILKVSPFTAEIYRYSVMQSETCWQPKYHTTVKHWRAKLYAFDNIPKDFEKEYKRIKDIALDKINAEQLAAITIQRNEQLGIGFAKRRMNIKESLEYTTTHKDEAIDSAGVYRPERIELFCDELGEQLFSEHRARVIARLLNMKLTVKPSAIEG